MREKTTEGGRERDREGESVGAHRCESVRQPHTHTHTHTHSGERGREREKRVRTRHIERLKAEKSGREKRL